MAFSGDLRDLVVALRKVSRPVDEMVAHRLAAEAGKDEALSTFEQPEPARQIADRLAALVAKRQSNRRH